MCNRLDTIPACDGRTDVLPRTVKKLHVYTQVKGEWQILNCKDHKKTNRKSKQSNEKRYMLMISRDLRCSLAVYINDIIICISNTDYDDDEGEYWAATDCSRCCRGSWRSTTARHNSRTTVVKCQLFLHKCEKNSLKITLNFYKRSYLYELQAYNTRPKLLIGRATYCVDWQYKLHKQ